MGARLIALPAGNASAWTGPTGNNTYLLPGRIPALVDAGVGNPDHLDAIARELGGQELALVLITHGHPDHASGAGALAARWPRVRIRQFGAAASPILADEAIEAGDGVVIAIHTPGHAPDHCCFLGGEDLFCGELVRLGGTVVVPGRRGGDLAQYLESLRRVRDLRPRRLLPGHGPMIDDPAGVIEEYLRHRAERERQIVEALKRGRRTPAEIVARIYDTLAPELASAAEESVLAHLIKLEREGRARERDDAWTLES